MFMPPSRRWDWIISLGDCRFLLFGILLIFDCQAVKGTKVKYWKIVL